MHTERCWQSGPGIRPPRVTDDRQVNTMEPRVARHRRRDIDQSMLHADRQRLTRSDIEFSIGPARTCKLIQREKKGNRFETSFSIATISRLGVHESHESSVRFRNGFFAPTNGQRCSVSNDGFTRTIEA